MSAKQLPPNSSALTVAIVSFSWNNQKGIDDKGNVWTVDTLLDLDGDEFPEGTTINMEDVGGIVLTLNDKEWCSITLADYEQRTVN
jgi:hypothetical protein